MTSVFLIILFIFYLNDVRGARILAVFPTPSISHQFVFRSLTRELVRRGHEVTVVTTDPAYLPGQAPMNLTEIDVHDVSYKLWTKALEIPDESSKNDLPGRAGKILRFMLQIFRAQIETKEVQDVIQKRKGEFDVLLIEAYLQVALIFSNFFKVPVIHVSSFGALYYNYKIVGAPTHSLIYPEMLNRRLYNLTIIEKISQLYDNWRLENMIFHVNQENDETMKSIFGPDTPSLDELSNNVHMLFLNVNPMWVDNQPVPTNVIYVGGMHMEPPRQLPKDLQAYMDSSENGIIYFSLGTNVNTSDLPSAVIQIFIQVFSELPFDILWKWDQDVLPEQTKNIKIMKWLPQADLLRHPNVRLFISQGGLQSTDEAISAGVPLIGIPFLGDQWYNVEKYVKHRIGIQIDVESLTVDKLMSAIKTIIDDKRYRENIVKLRTLMMDQPQTSLERAVWWTEHVIRHGGARHLRAAGANITWTQYLELELVLIVLSALLFGLIISVVSVYLLWQFIRQKLKSNVKRKFL